MISVAQFSSYVRDIFLSEELLHNISIYGEVSGFNITRGTAYFNLKDEEALLPCVKFSADELLYVPKEGDLVVVTGSPNYYIKGGKFSFVVKEIKAYGLGLLYKQFLEMKEKLETEGLFDEKNKKQIPKNIKKIGVVTSETGAVIQDIIDITRRRNPMLNILLCPAKVQGIGAEQTICDGIRKLDTTDVDVIIVARGGGSLEDLSPFNTEMVARAIYEAKKPIISAVGHETDFTIADFVADLRAPTPSAAAELVSVDLQALFEKFIYISKKVEKIFENILEDKKYKTETLFQNICFLGEKLITKNSKPYFNCLTKMKHIVEAFLERKLKAFEMLTNKIELNNPLSIMKKGFASVEKDGVRLSKIGDINLNDEVKTNLSDGYFISKIIKKEKKKWHLKKTQHV